MIPNPESTFFINQAPMEPKVYHRNIGPKGYDRTVGYTRDQEGTALLRAFRGNSPEQIYNYFGIEQGDPRYYPDTDTTTLN